MLANKLTFILSLVLSCTELCNWFPTAAASLFSISSTSAPSSQPLTQWRCLLFSTICTLTSTCTLLSLERACWMMLWQWSLAGITSLPVFLSHVLRFFLCLQSHPELFKALWIWSVWIQRFSQGSWKLLQFLFAVPHSWRRHGLCDCIDILFKQIPVQAYSMSLQSWLFTVCWYSI